MRTAMKVVAAAVVWMGVPGAVRADTVAKTFGQWRDKAKPVESLAAFLSNFVGDCGATSLGGKECLAKVEAYRKSALNQVFYVILDDEDSVKQVEAKSFNPMTHEYAFSLTPSFEAAGRALTEGQPTKIDEEGHPTLPKVPLHGKLADRVTPMDVAQVFKTGNVRIQLVFKPTGLWKLPRPDQKGSFYEGVKAQFVAVRLSQAQTGVELCSTVTAEK